MRFIMLGAPAAGKGTQSNVLSTKFNIPHVSTGDIFRENIKSGSELGKKVEEYINNGLLVPDELVTDIIIDRIQQEDCERGFILDGFPRTINQAVSLDSALNKLDIKIDKVINIELTKEQAVTRISGRRICEKCGATYNITAKKPLREGICDKCNSKLIQRKDDTEETIKKRLEIYYVQTQPLIEYYDEKGTLITISSEGSIDDVSNRIIKELGDE